MLPEQELLSLCSRPVPETTVDRAHLHLRDWLGNAVAARHEPATAALERFADAPEGHIVDFALDLASSDASRAAFLLGALGNILEMDDLHNASIMHAGNAIIPAAFATAIATDAGGPALLHAVVRGYEAAVRLGTAASANGYSPVMVSTACGAVGAAIAAADILDLSEEGAADALAQAGMMASMRPGPASMQPIWPGRA